MLNTYIYKGNKKLRCGYTTGSCAAAAAKAATEMLLTGRAVTEVELLTPKGVLLHLPVSRPLWGRGFAACSVRKDSGDDPDQTDGLWITATVEKTEQGIEITGGPGVGRVTKPGLDQPVGACAINTVPRRMIRQAVEAVSTRQGYGGGFRVTISVPGGEAVARKTYNPRMGIEGGISILGTSGIVEPMSQAALLETIRLEAKMRKAEGCSVLLLTVGNYSAHFLQTTCPAALQKNVTCSNFIGDAIAIGLELGFSNILLIGHIGKLVKLGAGIMNTHSAQADGRMEVLVTCGLLAGAESSLLRAIPGCVTVDAALAVLQSGGFLEKTMAVLADRTEAHLRLKGKDAAQIGAVMFSDRYGILVKTKTANRLLKEMGWETHG